MIVRSYFLAELLSKEFKEDGYDVVNGVLLYVLLYQRQPLFIPIFGSSHAGLYAHWVGSFIIMAFMVKGCCGRRDDA